MHSIRHIPQLGGSSAITFATIWRLAAVHITRKHRADPDFRQRIHSTPLARIYWDVSAFASQHVETVRQRISALGVTAEELKSK
jgi:hypothetical protein